MAAFLYVAVDAAGRERKGVLEGDTARHVRQMEDAGIDRLAEAVARMKTVR